MAGRGIGVKVFADLDMAALAAVIGQMKSIFGGAGREISGSLASSQAALKGLEDEMIQTANRAAVAEVDARKRAADAILMNRRAMNAQLKAEDERTAADRRALLMAPIADDRAAIAADAAVRSRKRATDAEADHTAALTKSADAATAAGVAYNRAGMAMTGGLVLGLGEGIKQAGEFDTKLRQMGAATDESAGQIKALHDQLLLLGPQVGRSLDELVSGAYMAAKAGFKDTAQQIDLVRTAAQLAAIEGAPLENTMKALTTSMNDFAFPAEKAAQVATMIKAAAGDAKVTLDEFAGSVHNLEPIFKSLVGGDASKSVPMFAQMNSMLAMMTQTGASADQSSDWLRNAMTHLAGSPTAGQFKAVGQLGGSFQDMLKEVRDPNVGPIGVMQQMNDLIAKQLGPNGMVQLQTMYRNKDAINLERTRYEALSPENKAIADQVQAGTMTKMTALRLASNTGDQAGRMADWTQAHKEVTGFDPLMKKFGGTRGSVEQLWNAMMGSQSGFLVASQMFGSPEAQAQLSKMRYDQMTATPEGSNVGGWSGVAGSLGVKTKELSASMQGLAVSLGDNVLPAFKSLVDDLKSVSDYFKDHQVLLHGLVSVAETFALIWTGGKLISGITKTAEAYAGLMEKLGMVKTASEEANATLVGSGSSAEAGAAGVAAASASEASEQGGIAAAAAKANAALAASGASAEAGAAAAVPAIEAEISAEAQLAVAAENADAAIAAGAGGMAAGGLGGLAGFMGAVGAVTLPAIGIGMGAGMIQNSIDPDDPNNGFTQAKIDKLSVPQGLPRPGSAGAEQAMSGAAMSGDKGAQWVTSTNNKMDQAARYAWLMNNQDADRDNGKNFKAPADYGQLGTPPQMPKLPGAGLTWVDGKGWVDADQAIKDNATGNPNLPDTYNPDYMGSGAGGGDGAGGKKGKKSDAEVDQALKDLGVSPDGTVGDPLYVAPAGNGWGSTGGTGGSPPEEMGGNPMQRFTHPNGLWGKNGVLGSMAGLMTTFLGELALGNPLGHMMTGEVSPYAWWSGAGGKGGVGMNKAEISANKVANAFDHLRETLSKYDENSPQARIALRNYQDAVLTQQDQAASGGGRGRRGYGGLGGILQFAPSGDAFGTRTPQGGIVGVPGSARVSAGAERYRGLATQISQQMGVDPKTWVPALLSQITTESGGDPMSVNSHDPNGHGGYQTVEGLFNYLPSTFAGAGGKNIWDPADQIKTTISHLLTEGNGSTPQQPRGIGYGQGWYSQGTPSVVPGPPSDTDDHLAMLPNGGLVGLAGGEGILNARTAQALGPDTINALNRMGSSAKLFGFAGGADDIGDAAGLTNGSSLQSGPEGTVGSAGKGTTAQTDGSKPGAASTGTVGNAGKQNLQDILMPGGTPGKAPGSSTAGAPPPATQPSDRPQNESTATKDDMNTGASKPGGGISGGIIGMAESAASSAAGMAAGAGTFGGASGAASAATQLAFQEANRAIETAGEAASTMVGEFPIETFGLTGKDLSGRSVNLMQSLPGKIIGGIMGGHPNLPNTAGQGDQQGMSNTQTPLQQSAGSQNVQTGDYTGVHVENMNVNNGESVSSNLNQYALSNGGQWLNRFPTFPSG